MKKALISTIEPRYTGCRVAQVVEIGEDFPVAEGLYWIDCEDSVKQDDFYFDNITQSILQNPIQKQASADQPTTSGTTTI